MLHCLHNGWWECQLFNYVIWSIKVEHTQFPWHQSFQPSIRFRYLMLSNCCLLQLAFLMHYFYEAQTDFILPAPRCCSNTLICLLFQFHPYFRRILWFQSVQLQVFACCLQTNSTGLILNGNLMGYWAEQTYPEYALAISWCQLASVIWKSNLWYGWGWI